MPADITLLCLPCAGASATMYLRWRRVLPAWIRVEPVELAGRGSRIGDPFSPDFSSAIDDVCVRMQPWLNGRYALYGHSMGALLAYGVVRRLLQTGKALPQRLTLGARQLAPGAHARARGPARRFAAPGRHARRRI
jgi:surfactin synthase thioesterase subunit